MIKTRGNLSDTHTSLIASRKLDGVLSRNKVIVPTSTGRTTGSGWRLVRTFTGIAVFSGSFRGKEDCVCC